MFIKLINYYELRGHYFLLKTIADSARLYVARDK